VIIQRKVFTHSQKSHSTFSKEKYDFGIFRKIDKLKKCDFEKVNKTIHNKSNLYVDSGP